MTNVVPETRRWRIYTRYASPGGEKGFSPPFFRNALLDTYESFVASLRFNDAGTWTMTLPFDHGQTLIADGAGIQVMYDDVTVFSGSVDVWEHDFSADEDTLTVFGFTDDVWLARRIAHPDPSAFAESSTGLETLWLYGYEEDVRTGPCEDVLIDYMAVNIGVTSGPARRFIGTIPTKLHRGATVTGRGRFQNLLTFMQELAHAGGDLGFRVLHAGNGSSPKFEVYVPVDRSNEVVFSGERGNLLGYKFRVGSPTANYVYLGLNNEGIDRYFLNDSDAESNSLQNWGRIEKFQDARDIQGTPTPTDAPNLAEAQQRAVAFLAENAEMTAFEATLSGTQPGARYPTDFQLGDKVGVELPDQSFDGVVRAVTVTLNEQGVEIRAEVSSASGTGVTINAGPTGRTMRDLHTRTLNLERR